MITNAAELYERFKGKSCKRLPKDSVLKERKNVHRIKMEIKEMMRRQRSVPAKPYILANLSKHHPNYGDTPQQDMQRKLENNS
jgi:hypothetical protein